MHYFYIVILFLSGMAVGFSLPRTESAPTTVKTPALDRYAVIRVACSDLDSDEEFGGVCLKLLGVSYNDMLEELRELNK